MPLTHANAFSKLDEIADTALIQLVYVSSLTLASRLNAAIFDEVEAHARDYNEQHGITGTLCYGNGHFLQCMEGEKAKVAALTQRILPISAIRRASAPYLQVITQRDFSDWRMRLLFWSVGFGHLPPKNKQRNLSPIYPLRRTVGQLERTEQFLQITQKPLTLRLILSSRHYLITRLVIWCATSPPRIKLF